MAAIKRLGILTAGGDCPGLNAVIRSVAKEAIRAGIEVFGIEDGFLGLIENRCRRLGQHEASGILTEGGTILGSSNKSNPTRFAVGAEPDGKPIFADVSDRCLKTIAEHKLDAMVVVGGDGSMTVAHQLWERAMQSGIDLHFIGVPKTIDNDLYGTDVTFGFATAVATATDALDKVSTTAASHHRVLFVELMGRNAGWITLHAGVASGADVILLPEIPFTFESLCSFVTARSKHGDRYSIVAVAEGAKPTGGEKIVARIDPTSPDPIRLGGIAKYLSDEVESRTGLECRYVVLGHVQRGGCPVAADRVLATQFGHHAVRLLKEGKRHRLVAMQSGRLTDLALTECAGKQRLVGLEDQLIAAARGVGTSFADGR
ncbi:MAG: Pyrophosphate--fructose 6-phosphate 1-phosphotransferase [Phycisphaerales bacterium]|nr:Pyrophosphate--fructose 6-phosphate 1-phosphotransferase [Phycisphaerales bacterium]